MAGNPLDIATSDYLPENVNQQGVYLAGFLFSSLLTNKKECKDKTSIKSTNTI